MFFDRHETRVPRSALKYILRILSVERAFQISTTASITRPAVAFVRVHYEPDLNFASRSWEKKPNTRPRPNYFSRIVKTYRFVDGSIDTVSNAI